MYRRRSARDVPVAPVVAAGFWAAVLCAVPLESWAKEDPTAPNIVWITSEDHGPEMGCYGDSQAHTPHIDSLAARGLRYAHCWSVAPVCAPARTAIISGMYPSSLGAEHMRSLVPMPAGTRMFPQLLRDAGYYCTNNSKEDYNLAKPGQVWDESSAQAHWRNRPTGQPFFAVFNTTVSHESAIRRHQGATDHDPAEVRVPAYHPDTPTVRRDWAIYYDSVTAADAHAGERLKEIEEAGLAGRTIVFYFGDHGSGMPRSKRWPGNSGLHVPLVVYIPDSLSHLRPPEYAAGGVSDSPVSFVDLAPTVLSLAGIEPPEWMQGRALVGAHRAAPLPYVFGERGRMDERLDLARSVSDGRYVYIRNYLPHRPAGQHVSYQFETPTTAQWRTLFDAGQLNPAQSAFWQTPRPAEELYDLQSDPDEVRNLAGSPEHADKLAELREAHRDHVRRILDLGFIPEGDRHAMAGDRSPYDWARGDDPYDVADALRAADMASDPLRNSASEVATLLDADSRVTRYWAAVGLLARGTDAMDQHEHALVQCLADASPSVRVTAARALAMCGSDDAADKAVDLLVSHADWGEHDVFTAMLSLDALGAVLDSESARALESVRDRLRNLPREGPAPHNRYREYVPRLLDSLP